MNYEPNTAAWAKLPCRAGILPTARSIVAYGLAASLRSIYLYANSIIWLEIRAITTQSAVDKRMSGTQFSSHKSQHGEAVTNKSINTSK